MRASLQTCLAAISVIVLAGCASPPSVVKLAGQTRRTANLMGNAYVADLEQVRSYDAQRTEMMNRLMREYDQRRRDLAKVYQDAFEETKAAAMARLLTEFDEAANKLLTHDFWLKFRASMDSKQATLLVEMEENVKRRLADSAEHPRDLLAEARAMQLLGTNAVMTALLYKTLDSSFAEFAEKLNYQRRAFRTKIEEKFMSAKLDFSKALSDEQPAFLTANAAEPVARRIADVEKARASLETAFTELDTYLTSDKLPWKDFVEGAITGLIGLHENGKLSPANSMAAADKAQATNAFPDLAKLREVFLAGRDGLGKLALEGQEIRENLLNVLRALLESKNPNPVPPTPTSEQPK